MKKLILITLLLIPLNTWAEFESTLNPNYYTVGLIFGAPLGMYSGSGDGVYSKAATTKTSPISTSKSNFAKSMSFGLYSNFTVDLRSEPPINILLEFMVTPTLVVQGGFGLGGTIKKKGELHSMGVSLGVGAGPGYDGGTTFSITDKKNKEVDASSYTPTDSFTTKVTPAFYYHFLSRKNFSLLLKAGVDLVFSDVTYFNENSISDSNTFNYKGLSVRPSIYIGFGGKTK